MVPDRVVTACFGRWLQAAARATGSVRVPAPSAHDTGPLSAGRARWVRREPWGPHRAALMARIVYLFRGGRADLLRRIAGGVAPREFLYGYDAFVEAGWATAFAECSTGDSLGFRRLLRPCERAAATFLGISFPLSTCVAHWGGIRDADIVISTTDGTTFPLLVLKRMGWLRGRVIAITQGIYERIRALERRPGGLVRVRVLASLLREASQLIVLGEGDGQAVEDCLGHFGLPLVAVVQFGADHDFWTPEDVPSNNAILSVGSDHLRDFPTLLRAVGDLPLRIVTRLELPASLLTPTVRVASDIDDLGLRRLYQESRFVVVPIKNERRDSGHSVAVQAMACGKAVVLSDTPGLWDREFMRDGETCRLVPPENPEALRRVIRELWDDAPQAERIGRAARRLIEERWTSRHFGGHLVALARSLL